MIVDPYEQFMVRSNVGRIVAGEASGDDTITELRANGYDRVANAVAEAIEQANMRAWCVTANYATGDVFVNEVDNEEAATIRALSGRMGNQGTHPLEIAEAARDELMAAMPDGDT